MESTETETAKKPKMEYPSRFQRRTLWSAITASSIVVIGAVVLGFILLIGMVLGYLQPVLVPLALAGIVAYLLQPIVDWLRKRGWPDRRAMMVVFVGFLTLIAGLMVMVVVPAFGQASEVLENSDQIREDVVGLLKKGASSAEPYVSAGITKEYYDKGIDWIGNEGPAVASKIGQWLWSRLSGAFGFFGYLLGLLLVPIYLFYFLKEGRKISQTWADYVPLRASHFKDEVVGTLTEINGYLISFFRGQMVVSLIDGALIAIALSLLGVPYALLIGAFLAILGLIPYIGNLLVMIPAIIIAIAHFGATEVGTVVGNDPPEVGKVAKVEFVDSDGETRVRAKVVSEVLDDGGRAEIRVNAWNWLPNVWAYPLIVLAIFVILQQINGLVTAPRIVGDSVGLHPLTVIFSVLFWSLLLGGLLGALLAVPLTASVKVLFVRYIWEKRLEPVVEKRLATEDNEDFGDNEREEPSLA
tara:strand:+ start:13057 stop:14466 length:1410 start_codon:yes stop_codon:yes gene_type:complete